MLQVSRIEGRGRGKKTRQTEKEIDRWKKRERARGWPREFEESVKGFDCSREKGTWGENGQK